MLLTNRKSLCFYLSLILAVSLFSFSVPAGAEEMDAETKKAWDELNAAPFEYIGYEDCEQCHEDYIISFSKTKMGRLFMNNPQDEIQARVCEACHGPANKHVASWEFVEELDLTKIISFKKHSKQTVYEQNEKCLQCHKSDHNRMSWGGSVHETQNVACVNCHRIMVKVSDKKQLVKKTVSATCFQCHGQKRAQMSRSAHMPIREGQITCVDCHNPHGGDGEPLLKKASVNETCYQCHTEKRGPMLWEHAPVRENCANCHDPHGTNYPSLLKTKAPWLCQSCHSAALHSSELLDGKRIAGGARPSSRVMGKFCVNCHSRIHGSNHPSGSRFQR